MIKKFFLVLLMGITTFLFAQTISPKKCNTCGKPLAQCQYKGRHPQNTQKPNKPTGQLSKPAQPSTPTSGYHNGHEWVDLGLPSGTRWATMNVGAKSASDYGSYYAWGETSTKSTYTWSNLKYCLNSSGDKFSKYVTKSNYGNVDGKIELDLSDDAAYVNWGSGWRMPSKAQIEELRVKCKWTWTMMGGHNGYKVVGPRGVSIFLPVAYGWDESGFLDYDSYGWYWSRTLETSYGYDYFACYLDFNLDLSSATYRYNGLPVRAVCFSE